MESNLISEVKRAFSNLSSKEYGQIRLFCQSQSIELRLLENLIETVVRDRWELALSLARCARSLSVEVEDNLGTIISRSYYACYHGARALVFFVTKSDIDDHKKLVPPLRGFLESTHTNAADLLDKWRDRRNEVDYSPYPFIDNLKTAAEESLIETTVFSDILRQEFRKRGLTLDVP
ncbi:hypothetical protein HYR99_31980 [Candidatus Poribacteria bacterium]|nr:hypothetical protein [Candidatus Poribacteria bacterium]